MNKAKQWINPSVLAMQAYKVPDASDLIKLDAMENPYTWPAELKQQWLGELSKIDINRYPDAQATRLKEKIRDVMNIPDELSIMLGNGSDELILIIALAMSQANRVFLAPEPSFVMYEAISTMTNTRYECVSLNADDFSLDSEKMLSAIKKHEPAVIFLAYPNNPTGNLFDEQVIFTVVDNAPGLVVLDEAYQIFSKKSFMDRICKYNNCIVMRTFSKSGLAGLRLGYLAGPPEWISEMEKIRLPYNINSLSQMTAEFILDNNEILERQADKICNNREKLFKDLTLMDDITHWPSAANFILFKINNNNADSVFDRLKAQGLLLKNLNGQHPLLSNCLRVTVGTESENTAFINALNCCL